LASSRRQIAFIQSLVAANPSWMQIVLTPADARAAIKANKLAIASAPKWTLSP
jgi:hypothetical protein